MRIEYLQLKEVASFLLHVFNALSLLLSEMQAFALHLQSYLLQLLQQIYVCTHTFAFTQREWVCVCKHGGDDGDDDDDNNNNKNNFK